MSVAKSPGKVYQWLPEKGLKPPEHVLANASSHYNVDLRGYVIHSSWFLRLPF